MRWVTTFIVYVTKRIYRFAVNIKIIDSIDQPSNFKFSVILIDSELRLLVILFNSLDSCNLQFMSKLEILYLWLIRIFILIIVFKEASLDIDIYNTEQDNDSVDNLLY